MDDAQQGQQGVTVQAGSLINSLKRKVHEFVENHVLLEAIIEEKEQLLGQKDAEIMRLRERIASLTNNNQAG